MTFSGLYTLGLGNYYLLTFIISHQVIIFSLHTIFRMPTRSARCLRLLSGRGAWKPESMPVHVWGQPAPWDSLLMDTRFQAQDGRAMQHPLKTALSTLGYILELRVYVFVCLCLPVSVCLGVCKCLLCPGGATFPGCTRGLRGRTPGGSAGSGSEVQSTTVVMLQRRPSRPLLLPPPP